MNTDLHTAEADKGLTSRQKTIFEFIRTGLKKMEVPHTQTEIARRFELKSLHGVRQHLKLMEKKGYLHLAGGKARGIRLTAS